MKPILLVNLTTKLHCNENSKILEGQTLAMSVGWVTDLFPASYEEANHNGPNIRHGSGVEILNARICLRTAVRDVKGRDELVIVITSGVDPYHLGEEQLAHLVNIGREEVEWTIGSGDTFGCVHPDTQHP